MVKVKIMVLEAAKYEYDENRVEHIHCKYFVVLYNRGPDILVVSTAVLHMDVNHMFRCECGLKPTRRNLNK